jgi:hypothetical protein
MTPEQVLAAILTIFPHMSGNNRACVEARRDRIVQQLTETTAAGVPAPLMASVAFMETHLGCDRNEGGNWGAPIDRLHRHTAGTHLDAARALLTGVHRCGTWDGAVMRFRSGMCRTQQPYAVRYVRLVNQLVRRIEERGR